MLLTNGKLSADLVLTFKGTENRRVQNGGSQCSLSAVVHHYFHLSQIIVYYDDDDDDDGYHGIHDGYLAVDVRGP